MPFAGDLRRIGLVRLLEVLAAGRKSGLLRLRNGRDGYDVYLRAGRCELVLPTKGGEPAEELVQAAAGDEDERATVRQLAAGDETGTLLMLDFLGISGRERSLALLRRRATAALRGVVEWQKGEFRFEPGVVAPGGRVPLGLPVAQVRSAGN